MNYFIQLIDTTNNILWTYILIALLLAAPAGLRYGHALSSSVCWAK